MSEQEIKLRITNLQKYIFLIIATFLVACSSGGHVEFQGIPIDGTIGVFTEKLKNIGYCKYESEREDQIKYSGLFLGRDCIATISATNKSKTPYSIRIDFSKEHPDSIKYSYEKLMKHCASVLGPGASKYQQFNSSSRFLFNEPKLIRNPRNGDFTRYLSRNGSVILEVKNDYLSITLIDRKNNELSLSEGGRMIDLENGREISH